MSLATGPIRLQTRFLLNGDEKFAAQGFRKSFKKGQRRIIVARFQPRESRLLSAHLLRQLFLGHTLFQSFANDRSNDGKLRLQSIVFSLDLGVFENTFLEVKKGNRFEFSDVVHESIYIICVISSQELNSSYFLPSF